MKYFQRSWLASVPLLAILMLPLFVLITVTPPATVLHALTMPDVQQAIMLSLLTASSATLFTVLTGIPLAIALVRSTPRTQRFWLVMLDIPTVLPPAVAGLALLLTFGRRGLLGSTFDVWGIQIAFTPLAVMMAQTFVAAPYFVKHAVTGFAGIQREISEAAAIDGATREQILRMIWLPLARRSLIAGMALTWARAMGEFGATLLFAGNLAGRTQTMPLAVYLGFERNLDQAIALSVILLLIAVFVLAIVHVLDRDQ